MNSFSSVLMLTSMLMLMVTSMGKQAKLNDIKSNKYVIKVQIQILNK